MFRQNRPQVSRSRGTLSLADVLLALTLCSFGAIAIRRIPNATYQLICGATWIALAFLYWRARMTTTLLIHASGLLVSALFFAVPLTLVDEVPGVFYYAVDPTLRFGVPLAVCMSVTFSVFMLLSDRRDYL